ncbi:hypothetical protein B0H11DRAFT_2252655 [Mycena galericulata]|nr:hypothetical protein B0H11DRAFT_2252655 [Mycena galericulata]
MRQPAIPLPNFQTSWAFRGVLQVITWPREWDEAEDVEGDGREERTWRDVTVTLIVYNLFPTFNMPEDLQIFDDDDLHKTLKDELGLIRMVTKLNTVQGKGKGIVNILDIEEDDCVDD